MAINHSVLTAAAKTTEGSIRNWLNRNDIPVTNILLEAEADIYQYLRVREMITDEAFTFSTSTSSKALSSLSATFLDPIQFVPYEWGTPLPFYHEKKMPFSRDSAGALFSSATASAWTIIGSTAHLDVLLSAAFSGRMMYYAQPTALSASNETNFLTIRYPSLLRYACVSKAYEHMKDWGRAKEYMGMMMQALGVANATNEMWRRSQHVPA